MKKLIFLLCFALVVESAFAQITMGLGFEGSPDLSKEVYLKGGKDNGTSVPKGLSGYGPYFFVDGKHWGSQIAMLFGSGSGTGKTPVPSPLGGEYPFDYSYIKMRAALSWKHPFSIPGVPKLYVFPLLNMGIQGVFGDVKFKNKLFNDDFSFIWFQPDFKLGAGAEYVVYGPLFVRLEALYGFTPYFDDSSLSHGPVFRLAAGYLSGKSK